MIATQAHVGEIMEKLVASLDALAAELDLPRGNA